MKGTKDRVFMVTNQSSRFSFLLRLAPGDVKELFRNFHGRLMDALKQQGVRHPVRIQLQVTTLSGAARSLSGFQNNQMYQLDFMVEGRRYEYLDDMEAPLNYVPTYVNGSCIFPDQEFARLCQEDPPFPQDNGEDKIIPFLN